MSTPIADHALLSNCRTAALVDRTGSVEWWCAPRFDSDPVFARLLGARAGHWRIGPTEPAEVERRYIEGTLVLVTTFRTASGTIELVDALAMADGVRDHDLGVDSPLVLLRTATCTHGNATISIEFSPRYEFGLTTPAVRAVDGGFIAHGGAVTLRLSTEAVLTVDGPAARGRVPLVKGASTAFAVEYGSSWDAAPSGWSPERISQRLRDTVDAWRSWQKAHQRYQGPYADLVHHSGRVLQGLTYRPTGAIVAAPTTSLPEIVGGTRNWDYRYTWIRDASLTLDALWVAACPDEARSFLTFLTTVASAFLYSGRLQIMFGVGGERDLSERALDRVEGWRDSRPVRVGNDAWRQEQLDVYGELLAAVHRLRDRLGSFDELERRFLIALADAAADRWQQTDHGIWEIRGAPRHYVHSKLLCWVALDRAIDLAHRLEPGERIDRWHTTRDGIRAAILEHGYSRRIGAFTQTFDGDELDASNLLISAVGFLPGDDPRVVATIEATEQQLTDSNGLVYRYRAADGLAGDEGTFVLCTFWLSEALARAGQPQRAHDVFARAARYCNDVGLLSEEIDPRNGELLGNFPQAFSHIGLVNAAWAISRAEDRAPGGGFGDG